MYMDSERRLSERGVLISLLVHQPGSSCRRFIARFGVLLLVYYPEFVIIPLALGLKPVELIGKFVVKFRQVSCSSLLVVDKQHFQLGD